MSVGTWAPELSQNEANIRHFHEIEAAGVAAAQDAGDGLGAAIALIAAPGAISRSAPQWGAVPTGGGRPWREERTP